MNKYQYRQAAAAIYINHACTGQKEYRSDIELLRLVQNDINRILEGKSTANPRRLLNRVITMFNIFGDDACGLILEYSDSKYKPYIHTILFHLHKGEFVCVDWFKRKLEEHERFFVVSK